MMVMVVAATATTTVIVMVSIGKHAMVPSARDSTSARNPSRVRDNGVEQRHGGVEERSHV